MQRCIMLSADAQAATTAANDMLSAPASAPDMSAAAAVNMSEVASTGAPAAVAAVAMSEPAAAAPAAPSAAFAEGSVQSQAKAVPVGRGGNLHESLAWQATLQSLLALAAHVLVPAGFLVTWLPYSPDPSYQQWLRDQGALQGLQLHGLLAEQRRSGLARGVAIFRKGLEARVCRPLVSAPSATSSSQHDNTSCAACTASARVGMSTSTETPTVTKRPSGMQTDLLDTWQHGSEATENVVPCQSPHVSGKQAGPVANALPRDAAVSEPSGQVQQAARQSFQGVASVKADNLSADGRKQNYGISPRGDVTKPPGAAMDACRSTTLSCLSAPHVCCQMCLEQ